MFFRIYFFRLQHSTIPPTRDAPAGRQQNNTQHSHLRPDASGLRWAGKYFFTDGTEALFLIPHSSFHIPLYLYFPIPPLPPVSFFTTFPPIITKSTFFKRLISVSGSPFTATRSANFPVSKVPNSLLLPNASAA